VDALIPNELYKTCLLSFSVSLHWSAVTPLRVGFSNSLQSRTAKMLIISIIPTHTPTRADSTESNVCSQPVSPKPSLTTASVPMRNTNSSRSTVSGASRCAGWEVWGTSKVPRQFGIAWQTLLLSSELLKVSSAPRISSTGFCIAVSSSCFRPQAGPQLDTSMPRRAGSRP